MLKRLVYLFVRCEGVLLYLFYWLFFKRKNPSDLGKGLHPEKRMFIFGSSFSINDITVSEWDEIRRKGSTMSFNMFYYADLVDIDYHVIREVIVAKNYLSRKSFSELRRVNNKISRNRRFLKAKYFAMIDSFSPGALLWYIFYGRRKCTYVYKNLFNRVASWPISESLEKIPHGGTTLFDCINISYILGYKEIVLVGVDLKDSRYFYLDYNESHWLSKDVKPDTPHPTQTRVLLNIVEWNNHLKKQGVKLFSYSDSSLLRKILPIYYKG